MAKLTNKNIAIVMGNEMESETGSKHKSSLDGLFELINASGRTMTFGLTPKGIAVIEKHISKFEDAIWCHQIWVDIGKEIAWDALTAALYYFEHLDSIRNEWLDGLYKEIMSQNPEGAQFVPISDIKLIIEKYGVKGRES